LLYTDAILCVNRDPVMYLSQVDDYFKMKPGSIVEPSFYVGVKLNNTALPNGVVASGMSSSKYVKAVV
jgi:hypothetical protein